MTYDHPIYQDADKLVYKTDDNNFVIAENGWIPGCYSSLEAAKLAFDIDEEKLSKLQKSVNPGGVITLEMLL